MTNHYFFGGRLHSPKPPSPGARLDVLVLRPVTSAIRDGLKPHAAYGRTVGITARPSSRS